MKSLALTGGIATGKSTFAQRFLQLAPRTVFFDCDASVRELQQQPEVIAEIAAALGDVLTPDGALDRAKLRALVFASESLRRGLEDILHPRVRAACAAAQQRAAADSAEFFLMDVPLLYESGFPVPREVEVVVACTPAAQRERLMARSKLTPETADRIMAAQLPITEKMRRATVVLWNGGTPEWLQRQTELCLGWLRGA